MTVDVYTPKVPIQVRAIQYLGESNYADVIEWLNSLYVYVGTRESDKAILFKNDDYVADLEMGEFLVLEEGKFYAWAPEGFNTNYQHYERKDVV